MTPSMTMGRIYAPLMPRRWYVREQEEESYERKTLLFHVEHGDYFLTLATILSLLQDQLETALSRHEGPTTYQLNVPTQLRKDLVYLAEHWRIEKK